MSSGTITPSLSSSSLSSQSSSSRHDGSTSRRVHCALGKRNCAAAGARSGDASRSHKQISRIDKGLKLKRYEIKFWLKSKYKFCVYKINRRFYLSFFRSIKEIYDIVRKYTEAPTSCSLTAFPARRRPRPQAPAAAGPSLRLRNTEYSHGAADADALAPAADPPRVCRGGNGLTI